MLGCHSGRGKGDSPAEASQQGRDPSKPFRVTTTTEVNEL